jgi:hypothetical protein
MGQLQMEDRCPMPAPSSHLATRAVDQRYGFWDQALDRINVDFSVSDDYDRSVADFRARYPQFAETPVHKRLATVVPTAL